MKCTLFREEGTFFAFVAIALVVLGLFVGLAVDAGRGYIMKAELERTVDSAAIAAASRLSSGLTAAQAAACNAALMNGVPCGNLTASAATVNDALGNPVSGVRVDASASTPTTFMRLAKLIGCGSGCNAVNAAASAVAAPGGTIDLVLDLDDTGSMSSGGWLTPAKNGANTLVNSLIPTGVTSSHPTRVSLVPFRGCYHFNTSSSTYNECEDLDEYGGGGGDIVSLSFSNSGLHNGINALNGSGGSGTNVCEGLLETRRKLFQSGVARANASKYIIVLTDGKNEYGTPGPSFSKCTPSSGGTWAHKVNMLAINLANDIKLGLAVTNDGSQNGTALSPPGSGQTLNQTVEIFVIFYGASVTPPANCGATIGSTSWDPPGSSGSSTEGVNVARCVASTSSHLYVAPTPGQLASIFQQIASRLPVKLVN